MHINTLYVTECNALLHCNNGRGQVTQIASICKRFLNKSAYRHFGESSTLLFLQCTFQEMIHHCKFCTVQLYIHDNSNMYI